jgi:integrase
VGTSLDHAHERVREKMGLGKEFVLHSLRHTMLTRLGEAGAEAFYIMKFAGHCSVTISQRYVHPTPEGMLRTMMRFQALNEGARGALTDAEVITLPAEVPALFPAPTVSC